MRRGTCHSGRQGRSPPGVRRGSRQCPRRRRSLRVNEDSPGTAAPPSAPAAPADAGVLRRLAARVRDGLYRPLAGDDDRVAYWVRHVRNGVLLSEIAAVAVVVYALLTHTPGGTTRSCSAWRRW